MFDKHYGKTIVIAEIGNNHEGDFNTAIKLIDAAKKAGVDAVKFQTFKTELYVSKTQKERYKKLKKFELSYEQFAKLSKYSRDLNLKFILQIPTLEILNNRGFGPKGQYHPDEPEFNSGAPNILNEYIRVQKIIIDTIKITLDNTAKSARKIMLESDWKDLELEEKARLVIFISLNKIKTLVNKDADERFDVDLYDEL